MCNPCQGKIFLKKLEVNKYYQYHDKELDDVILVLEILGTKDNRTRYRVKIIYDPVNIWSETDESVVGQEREVWFPDSTTEFWVEVPHFGSKLWRAMHL